MVPNSSFFYLEQKIFLASLEKSLMSMIGSVSEFDIVLLWALCFDYFQAQVVHALCPVVSVHSAEAIFVDS